LYVNSLLSLKPAAANAKAGFYQKTIEIRSKKNEGLQKP